jgi:hypothetical protein
MREWKLRLTCDPHHADGEQVEATESLTLSLKIGGRRPRKVELDLCADHAKALDTFLAPYLDSATAPDGIPHSQARPDIKSTWEYNRGMRAFADAHPGEAWANYTTPGGGMFYKKELRRRYEAHLLQLAGSQA